MIELDSGFECEFKREFERDIKLAVESGKRKKAFEIARNLKNMGFAISDIAKATGLTRTQVEKA